MFWGQAPRLGGGVGKSETRVMERKKKKKKTEKSVGKTCFPGITDNC